MARHFDSNRIRALSVAFFVALLVPGSAAAEVRGEPDVSVYLQDNRVVAGEETTLDVVLLNEGDVIEGSARNPGLEQRVTTARAVRVDLRAGNAPVTVKTGWQAIGNVPEGASQPVPFRVVVDENAEPGTYRVPIEVRYVWTRLIADEGNQGIEGRHYDDGRWETHHVTVVVEERARFAVVGADANVAVGNVGTASVQVRNVGSVLARDARVAVASSNDALAFGTGEAAGRAQSGEAAAASASSFVGEWRPGETRTLTYRVDVAPNAELRSYASRAVVAFEDGDGVERESDALPFGVTPSPEQTFAVEGVESTLRVGEEGRLRGTLVNSGESAVENAVVVLQSPGGTAVPTETEYAVGDLASGERASFEFEVETSDDADAGPRQYSYVVRYRDADGDELRSDALDVRAVVEPERKVFRVETVDADLSAGGSDRLTLRMSNAGDEAVTDVSAKLFADDPLSTDDDEAFVRALDPGEAANVTFRLSAAGDALAKEYPVAVDFRYDDADGDTELSDTYRVPVRVTAAERGGLPFPLLASGPTPLAVVAGLAVATLGVYLVRRR